MLGLSNEGMMLKCCELNRNAEYFVADLPILFETLTALGSEYDFSFFDADLDLYDIIKNCDMKFDCIIMNPPYQRNLHLKILAEAIKHLKDDESEVVNLSPIRWLQDPLAKYKKNSDYNRFEKSIRSHIEDVNVIYSKTAEEVFNIALPFNLGIYVGHAKSQIPFECSKSPSQLLISKLVPQYPDIINNHCQFSIPDKFAIVLSLMCGGSGNRTEDSDGSWFDSKKTFEQYCYHNNKRLDNGLTYYDNRKALCWGNVKPRHEQNNVQFNTQVEALNFFNACNTLFFKFAFKSIMVDVHVHPEFLPWMGDAVNPRTGKKGYESEWTDEDFYKFFGITDDEKKIIEETMAKYK